MIQTIPKRSIFLALILFLSTQHGHSTELVIQKEVSVTRALAGHVLVQGTDEPEGGVTVELRSQDWQRVIASTQTNAKGYFSLEPPGKEKIFHLRISAPGMNIYELRVHIDNHAAKKLTIRLSVAT